VRLIFVALAGIAAALLTFAGPAEGEASTAGPKWLALLDDQKYEESWQQAASMFRDQVKQDQWVVFLKRFRDPLGPPVSRTASRVDFAKTLRAAQDGDYAIVHFTTTFKNKSDDRTSHIGERRWQMAGGCLCHPLNVL
jgi:Protein of unknown function (DUF4019)